MIKVPSIVRTLLEFHVVTQTQETKKTSTLHLEKNAKSLANSERQSYQSFVLKFLFFLLLGLGKSSHGSLPSQVLLELGLL